MRGCVFRVFWEGVIRELDRGIWTEGAGWGLREDREDANIAPEAK